ncbi:hypothetical protein BV22DRAFT_402860 [Leucogyrophana mollusca]|uniref:Uncharacterized protein n=1 Tax=Leucogyrophana mollusca TaxID=85980 RepID=A0ACB8BLS9_9AGAM|nr:hypothetical protein BV22DRAFT_402860 [Leucogyrophana mollusca]
MNALSILSPRPSLSSAPRTPRTRSLTASPPAVNRLSTDSWNSSNGEFEDLSVPWSPDHLRLLARTLDALPSHLTTPFNGPVPPSNLLHKIATGIAQAKGPNDWPHSVRATRIKLLHIARDNASDHDNARGGLRADVLQQTTNTASPRRARPLYRQSSMDFMLNAKLDRDLDHNDTIARLSHRLQKHERTLTSSYHPYLRPAKHHSLAPSTPSSSTLNSSSAAPRSSKPHP